VIIGGNGLTESQPSLSIKVLNSQRIIFNRAREVTHPSVRLRTLEVAMLTQQARSMNLRMMQHQLGLFCQFDI
jgi:hypothetical protein